MVQHNITVSNAQLFEHSILNSSIANGNTEL